MDRIAFIIGETFVFWSPIILAVSALAACCWFVGLYLGRTGKGIAAFLAVPMAFVTSMLFSRIIHWYCRTDSYASFEVAITDYTSGGYALLGVFAGCFVTACVLRLIQVSKSMPEMLDCMAVAGAVGISTGRLACLFDSSDRGMALEGITELPLAYPVTNSVTGEQEYRLATFMLQSLVTAGIFVVLLLFWLTMKRKGKKGDTFLLFALLYGAAQAVLDSTRYDSLFLRSNGFVSVVQIMGAVSMVLAIVWYSVRMAKSWGWRIWFLPFWIFIGGCLGGAGYMEYYVQRHGDLALFAYTVMTGCLIGTVILGIAIYVLAVVGENSKRLAQRREARKELKREKKKNRRNAREIPEETPVENTSVENTMPVMVFAAPGVEETAEEAPAAEETPEEAEVLPEAAENLQEDPETEEPVEAVEPQPEVPADQPEAVPAVTLDEEDDQTDPENRIAPDAALAEMSTDELLDHLKKLLEETGV